MPRMVNELTYYPRSRYLSHLRFLIVASTLTMIGFQIATLALQFGAVLASIPHSRSQEYLGYNHAQNYDSGLFTPFEYLDLLSEYTFSTLTHPLFPHYGVRVKKSKFCDETVK